MGAALVLKELSGINRVDEPVTRGISLKKGLLFDNKNLCLMDGKKVIPAQTIVLSRWNDDSIKWLLVDFKFSLNKNKKKKLFLKKKKIKRKELEISVDKLNILKGFKLIGRDGRKHSLIVKKHSIETQGSQRTTVRVIGCFKGISVNFTARFSYYSNNLLKLDFTIRNPRAAKHSGGFWDLRDENSVLFKDLSLRIGADGEVSYKDDIKKKFKKCKEVIVYEGSSSEKHQPTVKVGSLSVAVKDFWQNFPKAIEADEKGILIKLFPNGAYELQGGEQKTHTIYFDYDGNDLDWIQNPLVVNSDYSDAISYLGKVDKRYQKLIDCAIKGKDSFEKKNEKINEYGWRNFGDIYADHEAIYEKGLVSHYNNQYDVVNGALLQFFRSGDSKWFEIASNMAKHVIDIDIYHTKQDKAAYNNGMFWHTFHYVDAYTSTHRSYSKLGAKEMSKFDYGLGGGPGAEHNYATGLMNYYYLTGDLLAKEAVIGLVKWVIDMDDGSKSVLRYLNNKRTGKASCSESVYYHGPGRGNGNSVNTLIDGFEISGNKKYLKKAEELIRRCIHPNEDISKNNLEDIEHRWFYLVFLQALGRYLDLKLENNDLDYMFYYAKQSLIHYSEWILVNEVPYKDVLEKVDIPTETWSAQDIRKTIVLDFAYRYSGEERFKEKADFFFNRCIKDLNDFKTKTFTRPLAILMNYSGGHENVSKAEFVEKEINFGNPKEFKSQGHYFYKVRDIANKFIGNK